jgi:molybdate transport system regulatory protein
MEIKYKIWIEENGKVIFDKGRYNILKAIDKNFSLKGAVKELGISYRWAWDKLVVSQETMELYLVETGTKGKYLQLTPLARTIMDRFEKQENDVEKLLQTESQDFQKLIRDAKNNSRLEKSQY